MNNISVKEKSVREPLFHIAKRAPMPFWQAALVRAISILSATILCSIMSTVLIGENPFEIFGVFFEGIFLDPWTLMKDLALLLAFGLAVVPAFKMKYWNMGANGQVLMGCLAAIYCMDRYSNKLPEAVTILIMLLAAIVFSVLWSVIPAIFKALFNTNETLFTLMMNYIAIGIVNQFNYTRNHYKNAESGIVNLYTHRAWLPVVGHQYVLPILIVALLTAFVTIYMKRSKHGYEISVVGESENTARYVGINVKKVIVRTLIVSGIICGVIGFLYASAIEHSVSKDTATLGFTAILIAWLGKFNPLTMILTAFFVVAMKSGAGFMNKEFALGDAAFSEIITGIVFFFIIGCEFFIGYTIKRNKNRKGLFSKIKEKKGTKTEACEKEENREEIK